MYRLQTQLLSEIRFVVPVLPKSGDDQSQIFECKSIKQNDVEIYAIIRALVLELYQDRIAMRDHTFQFSAELSYREAAFIKHLSIYLCHVVLGHSMRKIATGFELDRTSVSYACRKIEDMRDDDEKERFISMSERLVEIFSLKPKN